jgi:hypothetical protein
MTCDDVRAILEETGERAAPEGVLAHLSSCATCAEWLKDWRTMTEGFRLLAQDVGPEPSWGFAERVVRRLDDSVDPLRGAVDLIERAGRRVVWATFAMTLAAVLALIVPSSGPVRAASEPEYLLVQPQSASGQNEQILDVDNVDDSASQAVQPAAPSGEK